MEKVLFKSTWCNLFYFIFFYKSTQIKLTDLIVDRHSNEFWVDGMIRKKSTSFHWYCLWESGKHKSFSSDHRQRLTMAISPRSVAAFHRFPWHVRPCHCEINIHLSQVCLPTSQYFPLSHTRSFVYEMNTDIHTCNQNEAFCWYMIPSIIMIKSYLSLCYASLLCLWSTRIRFYPEWI